MSSVKLAAHSKLQFLNKNLYVQTNWKLYHILVTLQLIAFVAN